MSIDIEHLQQWVGKQESLEDQLTPYPANALAATLDRAQEALSKGDFLPPLWHWLYFLTPAAQQALAADGHPNKGGFLPPVPLPRRMWAGSRFEFVRPLQLGCQAKKTSTIKSVNVKQGKSGELAFVCVGHEVCDELGLAFSEEHDIVYRDNPPPADGDKHKVAPGMPAPSDCQHYFEVTPDPVLLFRYSALTFNGHRIHYDRDYTTAVEGYPGLIVHGPLIATLLMELLHRHWNSENIKTFEFKALRPVFDLNRFRVCGNTEADGKVSLWIQDHESFLCMKATATLAQ